MNSRTGVTTRQHYKIFINWVWNVELGEPEAHLCIGSAQTRRCYTLSSKRAAELWTGRDLDGEGLQRVALAAGRWIGLNPETDHAALLQLAGDIEQRLIEVVMIAPLSPDELADWEVRRLEALGVHKIQLNGKTVLER